MHADFHHVVEGRVRLGHEMGFGMCLWHHRGESDWVLAHLEQSELVQRMGPSFQRQKKRFIEVYGTERTLVELNDFAISLWLMRPWLEHCMPADIGEAIRAHHVRLLTAA